MSHPEVHGVVVLARNGDRGECYQDPLTYKADIAKSTPLGEVQSHLLGSYLRNVYLNSDSSSHVRDINTELVDLKEVHIRVKVGAEGASVFDSATAVLQGLFPPTPKNRITLANETTIVSPLGGYQYIPVETVEPSNDRSLEPWTDCPAFEEHVKKVLSSSKFQQAQKDAQPFFRDIKDYVFGRPTTIDNAYNIWDYMNTQLIHNITFAHRLPPTLIEQARGLADLRENAVFSDPNMAGIGNIASRTALSSVISALQRIAFNDDPLQFMLIETTYQPFISLFHQTDMIKGNPELQAIPDFGSALAIELRRSPPDSREFLRFKFRNGTEEDFRTVHVFGHKEDIALTEFIYRLEGSIIKSNSEWARACGGGADTETVASPSVKAKFLEASGILGVAFLVMMFAWLVSFGVKRYHRRNYIRLRGEEAQIETVVRDAQNEKAALQLRQ